MVSDPNDPTKTLRYGRPSGFAKPLDDEFALTNWRIFKAMDGVARSKALQTQVIACRDDDREEKGRLREVALDKGQANERADQGTGLHAMTVRAEDVKDVDFDPGPHAEDLDCYLALLRTYGLESAMVEVALVNDEYRAAGTADRIYRLTKPLYTPDGTLLERDTLVVGDLKTGAKLDFSVPGYCVQCALYATGVLYDVISERRLPTPPIDKNWSLLVHLPVGAHRATLYWCSVQLGLYGAWLSFEVKQWQAKWKRGEHDITVVQEPFDVVEALVSDDTAQIVMTESMEEACSLWASKRMATISESEIAKQWVIAHWPDGVQSPKKGTLTGADLVKVLDVLAEAEQKFSIPWMHADPRVAQQMGVHKSAVDRSNSFALINE